MRWSVQAVPRTSQHSLGLRAMVQTVKEFRNIRGKSREGKLPTGILSEQIPVNPSCSLTGKLAGKMEGRGGIEGREDAGKGGCRERRMQGSCSCDRASLRGSSWLTTLQTNKGNQTQVSYKGRHNRREETCSLQAVTRHSLPGCKGHLVPTDSKFTLATQ